MYLPFFYWKIQQVMSEAYLWFFFVIYDFKNHNIGSESECEPIVDIFGIALKDNDCKQYVRHIMGSEMAV